MTQDAKSALRRRALAGRGGPPDAARRLLEHVLRAAPPPPGTAVAGFWPMGTEMDIRPLLHALHARGHALALPRTPPRGRPLAFHAWAPGDALEAGPMGTSQPAAAQPLVTPGLLLVPLLAFDRRGVRLGYGGGYYDRTLPLFPAAFRLGIAFAAQEVDEVPMDPHDIPLHAIATEAGVIRA